MTMPSRLAANAQKGSIVSMGGSSLYDDRSISGASSINGTGSKLPNISRERLSTNQRQRKASPEAIALLMASQ